MVALTDLFTRFRCWRLAGGLLLIFAIANTLMSRMPPISRWEQQHLSALQLVLIFGIVGALGWYSYRIWRWQRAGAWNKRGLILARQKRYQEAIAAYERASAIAPKSAAPWSNRGIALVRLDRFDEALAAYDHAISLDKSDDAPWLNRGVILSRLKSYDEALVAYNHALALNPTEPLVWYNLASLLSDDLNRRDKALVICESAFARGISIAGIWATKGDALHALGQEDEARAAYEQVLTFPNNDFLSWASRGQALAGVGRKEEALSAYDIALTFNVDAASVLRKKAGVLRALGREAEAQEAERRPTSWSSHTPQGFNVWCELAGVGLHPAYAQRAFQRE